MGAEFSVEELVAGEAMFGREWRFVRSVPSLGLLPPSEQPEIAFAGRSNVGKSSLINALAGRRGLARTSNTPGRTQELNFFDAPSVSLGIVDMPGYGFAQAPKTKVEAWTRLVKGYLRGRSTLCRVFLLIDARHGLKAADQPILELMDRAAVSYQVVLTKSDKVKPHHLADTLAAVRAELEKHPAAFPSIRATSAETGEGIAELRAEIARVSANSA